MTDTLSPPIAREDLPVASAITRRFTIPSAPHLTTEMPTETTGGCLHDVFAASARRTPAAPAVLSGGVLTSYAELEQRSDRWARRLAARGVRPGAAIGVSMERSADAYAALLAVLKTGAAYVGLDPSTPPERVAAIAADCAMDLVLHDGRAALPPCVEPIWPADLEASPAHAAWAEGRQLPRALPDDLCYIIYTSGSTGRPKGVGITHRAAAHYVHAAAGVYDIRAADRVWQGFSLAFDASVEEIWLAFAAGACLVSGTRDQVTAGPSLADYLAAHAVTVFSCVPTTLALFERDVPSLRLLIVGGEPCPPALVARWARPGRRMLNTYGPTEATVVATWAELEPGRPVTIGRPLPGYRTLLLDDERVETPAGTIGQLYIGGPGLARGYVNQPALTAERFIDNPYVGRMPDAPRLYASGDLARLDPDGALIFCGRRDGQVKIRGFRVELGEIEAALLAQPGVRAAAAAVHERVPGQRDLVAYVVLRTGVTLDRAGLRAALRAHLPSYMLPAFVETLETLPVGASGKLDRAALPRPAPVSAVAASDIVAPANATEAAVAAACAHALGHARVSVVDDFFLDLGGHSLAAARVVCALREEQGALVDVPDLYAHPTVRRLATLIAERAAHETAASASASTDAGRVMASLPVPRLRHALCGAGQALALYPLFLLNALPLLLPFVALVTLRVPSPVLLAAIAAIILALGPLTMGLALAAKWTLIGRYHAGSHPLWGGYYIRWWVVQRIEGLVPLHVFAGSPLLVSYARLMGARIGRDAYLGTTAPVAWDLLEIADGASVGDDASVSCYAVTGGRLQFGRVRIGRDSYVGARALLAPDAVVDDGAALDALSMLGPGEIVPAGERWGGSPAQRLDEADADLTLLRAARTPRAATDSRRLPYALAAAGIMALPLLAGLPELPLVLWGYERLGGLGLLLVVPPSAILFALTLSLLLVAVKWLLPPVRPGVVALGSAARLRHWAIDRLLLTEMEHVPTLFGTLYAAPWLRLLGATIGHRSEVSTVAHFAPDLVSVGPSSFLADDVYVHTTKVCAGHVLSLPARLGAGSFIGNSACVSMGAALPDDCLVGVLSLSPRDAAPNSSWLGSPPIALPRRQLFDGFDDAHTVTPPRRLVAVRLTIEAWRILLPAILVGLAGAATYDSLVAIHDHLGLGTTIALAPIVDAVWGGVMALLVVGVKWTLVGRYRPRVEPLWSHFVWRSEVVTGLYEAVAVPLLLETLSGTPFAAPYLRLLGATIGKRAYLESLDLTEFDLVDIGDDAALGHACSIQTHLFEDRIMKMDRLSIGAGCVVGARAVVLYGSALGAGAELGPLSLMMKGESFGPATRWAGLPARRGAREAPAPATGLGPAPAPSLRSA